MSSRISKAQLIDDLTRRMAQLVEQNRELLVVLRGLVAVHDMGGVDGPYANPNAVESYLSAARTLIREAKEGK